jgi:hypothetical protein
LRPFFAADFSVLAAMVWALVRVAELVSDHVRYPEKSGLAERAMFPDENPGPFALPENLPDKSGQAPCSS